MTHHKRHFKAFGICPTCGEHCEGTYSDASFDHAFGTFKDYIVVSNCCSTQMKDFTEEEIEPELPECD